MALVTCPYAFRLRRLAQNVCRGIGVRHFSFKFPYEMALVTCPCAFRLRRLAQERCSRRSVVRPFFLKISIQNGSSQHVHVCFDCAGSCKTMSPEVSPAIFLVNFRTNGSCEMLMCISTAQARTKRCFPEVSPAIFPENFHKMALLKCPCVFRLRRLVQNDVPGGVPGHFSLLISAQNGSCEMLHVHFDCAGSHEVCFPVLGSVSSSTSSSSTSSSSSSSLSPSSS